MFEIVAAMSLAVQALEDPRILAEDPAGFARYCTSEDLPEDLPGWACLREMRFRVEQADGQDEAVAAPVRPLLDAPDAETRIQALLTLGWAGDTASRRAVEAHLEAEDWREVFVALRVLGAIGDAESLERLRGLDERLWMNLIFNEAIRARIALGDMPPFTQAEIDWRAGQDESALAQQDEYFQEMRRSVLIDYGRLEGEESRYEIPDPLWVGDTASFTEPMGVRMDDNFDPVPACPTGRYRFGEESFNLFEGSEAAVRGPSRRFEIALPGGRVIGEITEVNIQYIMGMPGRVVWEGEEGATRELIPTSIAFHTQQGADSLIIANPGAPMSPGAVYALAPDAAGGYGLRTLFHLPAPAGTLVELEGGRFAVRTRSDSVIVFDREGPIEQAYCSDYLAD